MFEELDRRSTAQGEISLRRRFDPSLRVEVHEVRLADAFLMSSLFTVAEEELARLTLAAIGGGGPLDVVVGGLGLGCTARAALEDRRVRSVRVIEAAEPVIEWHRAGLVPLGAELTASGRCRFVPGDFFRAVRSDASDDDAVGDADAVLLDIDHSPRDHLHPDHAAFYTEAGLVDVRRRLRPGGAFGLWSDDPPEAGFTGILERVFAGVAAHVVEFPNPYTGETSANTVYVATTPG
ncbi:spermidine synthase [Iamia sp. SCSIO 61187]|uniref:spermidine synthase n=1 Tax=Iamia sp. SCSIO 61187 TaxID=2722752 RepID=UPI0021080EFE|nr:spermidine synthase [Iamia sp. SCSIO 61187]QYG94191.1 spermidine synthase [Iamia sp. SCSIO 61187]